MVNIDQNRMQYNSVSRIQNDAETTEQWQKQDGQKKQMNLPPRPQLAQHKKLNQKQLSTLSKASQTSQVNQVQSIDKIDVIDGIETVQGISAIDTFNMDNIGHFDIKQDIADFVKPPIINPEFLSKKELAQTAKDIMRSLDEIGASDMLIGRAKNLFDEENMVKSVTDAYKNALIFA